MMGACGSNTFVRRCAAIAALLSSTINPSHAFTIDPRAATSTLQLRKNGARRTARGPIDAKTRGVPSRLSASPSGIDELPALAQAAAFVGIYAALGAGTVAGAKSLDVVSTKWFGLERWRNYVIETYLPLALGSVYVAAGIGHFVAAEAFRGIYPPPGTWGIWYVPGSAEFHVAWTGVVEAMGGSGLWYGAFRSFAADEDEDERLLSKLVQPISALALFVLTTLETPANIYMYTHGATFGPDVPPLGMQFHAIRFAIQVLLLSQLWALAKDSFFYAWGDELD